jgi:hypothetical protein
MIRDRIGDVALDFGHRYYTTTCHQVMEICVDLFGLVIETIVDIYCTVDESSLCYHSKKMVWLRHLRHRNRPLNRVVVWIKAIYVHMGEPVKDPFHHPNLRRHSISCWKY